MNMNLYVYVCPGDPHRGGEISVLSHQDFPYSPAAGGGGDCGPLCAGSPTGRGECFRGWRRRWPLPATDVFKVMCAFPAFNVSFTLPTDSIVSSASTIPPPRETASCLRNLAGLSADGVPVSWLGWGEGRYPLVPGVTAGGVQPFVPRIFF